MGYVGCLIRKDSAMVEPEKEDSTVIELKKKNLIMVEMIERLFSLSSDKALPLFSTLRPARKYIF
jgi:hypothetical protein